MNRNIYTMPFSRKKGFKAWIMGLSIVTQLLGVTIAFSIISFILISINQNFLSYIALKPSNILQGKMLWTLVTHIFVHGGAVHLLVNMFVLFSFGYFCEQIIGKKRFFWLYIISGLFAGILSAVMAGYFGMGIWKSVLGSPDIYMVGASGALFGIITLLAVLIPQKKVFLVAGPLILIILEVILGSYVPANLMGFFSFIINLLMLIMVLGVFIPGSKIGKYAMPIKLPFWLAPIAAIVPLIIISFFVELPIGNVAHLGGALVGLVYGIYLRNKYKKKVNLLGKMFR